MKTLNLKLTGLSAKARPIIKVDGEILQAKKNDFGSFEASLQTEKTAVEIEIARENELLAKFWWLYALISFLVSIFGIFEPPYDRKCIVIDYKTVVQLGEGNSELTIKFNNLSSSGRACEIETSCQIEEVANEYRVDKKAKTRWRIILAVKILFWIAAAILIGILISKKA